MFGVVAGAWLWLFVIAGTATVLSVVADGFRHQAWLRSLLLGATNGVCAAYAGIIVPLTFGLSITQLPAQVVVGACVLVGCMTGWFVSGRRVFPLVVALSGVVSFVATVQAIARLYPPKLSG